MELQDLLEKMMQVKGSDLHIRANLKPYVRVDGKLMPLVDETIPAPETERIATQLMDERQLATFHNKRECDMAVSVPGTGRFRLNVFQQKGTINIAVRYIPEDVPAIDKLDLPPIVGKLADNVRGLVLVTGPTGSGKSTTLAAMVNHINMTRAAHIITIEDPIEFLHSDKKSIVSQRELGVDTFNYHEALRHVVRQNPDVILIGEMRDQETMAAAMTAAQLGHLVLATLHTIDTIQTISRIVDLFPPHQHNQIRYQLADTLKGIVSQRLLGRAAGKGMLPAVEVLVATPLVKKHIEENNLSEINNLIRQGQYYGMQNFNQALMALYQEKKVTLEEALRAASSPEEFMLVIRGVETSTRSSQNILERFDKK